MTSREIYGSERPRITDFGIAKLAASEITTTGQLLGTPSFMPPEQFTGTPIDGRADLFSLGVILYALATGEQPFPGETMTAVSYKVVYTEPIPPAKLNPAIPRPWKRDSEVPREESRRPLSNRRRARAGSCYLARQSQCHARQHVGPGRNRSQRHARRRAQQHLASAGPCHPAPQNVCRSANAATPAKPYQND